MTDKAKKIAALIDAHPDHDSYPFIFNSAEPRYLGQVGSRRLQTWGRDADALLIKNRLSATYLSRAEVLGRICIIAH